MTTAGLTAGCRPREQRMIKVYSYQASRPVAEPPEPMAVYKAVALAEDGA
jgi:hypothetical protein